MSSFSRVDKTGFEYSQKKLLGKGNYGAVHLAERVGEVQPNPFNNFFFGRQDDLNKYCAIKSYFENLTNNEGVNFSTLREINLLLTTEHQHLVSAYESFYHRERIQVVMDFYLDLSEVIHDEAISGSEDLKKLICYQVACGVAHLHDRYILHRDLKPHNIFVSKDGLAKIGDFGMSKEFGTPNRKFTPYACTKEYRAPELFLKTEYYTQKTDIWSLGCIFYYIFTGENLFAADNGSDLGTLTKIFSLTGTPDVKSCEFKENNWIGYRNLPKYYEFLPSPKRSLSQQKGIDSSIAELIEQCLALDPKARPSAKEILQHSFFEEFEGILSNKRLNVDKLYDKKLEDILNKA